MKLNIKLISSFLLCLCISFTIQTNKFQAIWVVGEGASSETSALMWAKNYLVIKTKFFDTQENLDSFDPVADNYKILIRRSDVVEGPISIVTNPANQNYQYKYYIPSIELAHKLPYVIYDIKLNHCVDDAISCHIEYKIKFFSCNQHAGDFYDDLSTSYTDIDRTDALLVLSPFIDTYEKRVGLTGQFTQGYSIQDLLTGSTMLNCQVTSNTDCCNPYPCSIDSTSIECICRLEGYNGGPGALTGVCKDYTQALS